MLGLLSCALREMSKGKMKIFHIAYDPNEKKALFVFEDLKQPGLRMPFEIGISSGPALERVEEGTLVIDMRSLHDF
jgi:DNA-directed RNA polymerase subunit K/omega